MARQLTKAEILANYEAALVRVQHLEAELASARSAQRDVARVEMRTVTMGGKQYIASTERFGQRVVRRYTPVEA